MAPSNTAAWLNSTKENPLVIRESPYISPGPKEVLIKNYAYAINPLDNKIQDLDLFQAPKPLILGGENAGVVEEVGEGVTHVKKGDRIASMVLGTGTKQPQHGGYQTYTTVPSTLATKIPSSFSWTKAVALPVGAGTAAAALYSPTHFALPLPSLRKPSSASNGTIIVYGASSSVGLAAVQEATFSGLEVIATAGAHNHDLVYSLGASEVFDHKDPEVVSKVVAAAKGKSIVGIFDTISLPPTNQINIDILSQLSDAKKLIIVVQPPFKEFDTKGAEIRPIFSQIISQNGIGEKIFGDWFPQVLESGAYKPFPEPNVVGKGLGDIQKGLDITRKGVSASKNVVEA